VLADLAPGEFFGEMAIVNTRPRSATARILEDARLLVIDAKTFAAMVQDRAEIALRMIKTLAARLEQANYQIELLLLKDGNHRVTQCLRRMAEQQGPAAHAAAGVFIPVTVPVLASRVALDESQVAEVLARLRDAKLVTSAREIGYAEDGLVVPEVGRLVEFVEFLDMKERFARA
jgi:CRP-like cAMP-binding protein